MQGTHSIFNTYSMHMFTERILNASPHVDEGILNACVHQHGVIPPPTWDEKKITPVHCLVVVYVWLWSDCVVHCLVVE